MKEKESEPAFQFVEDEQTEKIKRWWKTNGTAVIVGLLLGVGSVAGYQGWGMNQDRQSEIASDLYQRMLRQSEAGKIVEVRQTAGQLISQFASTTYVDTALLMLARLEVEEGRPEQANTHLDQVIENSDNPAMRHVARLRLASLVFDRGELDRAQQVLSVKEMGGFESQYLEIQGDILMARGEIIGARNAYERALTSAISGSVGYQMLDRKLNNTQRVGNDQ